MTEFFNDAGLTMTEEVKSYIEYSSRGSVGKVGVTTTVRDSAGAVDQWRERIAEDVKDAVDSVTEGSSLMDYFV